MTTIDTRPDAADAELGSVAQQAGVALFFATAAEWVTTADHKRIGRLYTAFGMLALLGATVLGVLLGAERADDGGTIVDADALLQLFQSYRVGLVFGAIIPLGLGLSIAVVPLQLGARSIAFPRLALTGFYAWLGGLSLTFVSLGRNGGMGGGDDQMVALFLAALGLMIVGLLASAGSVATSVLTTRAPGMTMRRVPLFAWSALIGAIGMLIALPVLFGVIIYTYLDMRYAQLNFGGSSGIVAWIGWAFTVPAIAVYSLPAIGVAAELVPVTFKSRQVMRGVTYAGITLVGVAALAASTQQFVHDITFDTDGQTFIEDAIPFVIFAGLPLLGVLIVMLLGAATAKAGNGRPNISAPFVFALLGVDLVAAGLIANVLRSITDLDLLGTSTEEGATLLIVYGTALSVMGGLAFWAPKLWGRKISDAKAMPLALLGTAGAALAGISLTIAGFLEQPGGVPASDIDVAALLDTSDAGSIWQILALAGHAAMALTILGFTTLMLTTFTGSDDNADDDDDELNPYGAHTIEWSAASPAPLHNFEQVPAVTSAEPLFDAGDEGNAS